MGGKRPDQHNIDPGEAGATDYKFRSEEPTLHEEAKHQLVQQDSHIPKRGENPALADLKAKREAKAEQEQDAKLETGTDEQPPS